MTESVINDVGRTSIKDTIKNAVTKGATDAAFAYLGGKIANGTGGTKLAEKIKNSKNVSTITDKIQGSNFVQTVKVNRIGYQAWQKAARRLFGKLYRLRIGGIHEKFSFSSSCKELKNVYSWNQFRDFLYMKQWIPFIKETVNGFGNAIDYLVRYTLALPLATPELSRLRTSM